MSERAVKTTTNIALALILALYVISFFLPVRNITSDDWPPKIVGVQNGWQAFKLTFFWPYSDAISWMIFACQNPLFWAASICAATSKWKAATVLGLLSLAAGSLFYFLDMGDEQPLLIGYWVWMGSFALLTAVSIWRWPRRRKVITILTKTPMSGDGDAFPN